MRVITGSARGRKLKTMEGMDTRPTSDRVKEAVFSAIQFDLPGSVFLDLFAGSGQMGIEALSRGAKQAVFNDLNPKAVQVVRDNLLATGFSRQARVLNLSLEGFLRTDKTLFDLAYLDPPYRPISETSAFTSYNRETFDDEEQRRLAAFIKEITDMHAKVVLSNSDPKNINEEDNFFDELYQGYQIKRVSASRMINSNAERRGKIKELIICNQEE